MPPNPLLESVFENKEVLVPKIDDCCRVLELFIDKREEPKFLIESESSVEDICVLAAADVVGFTEARTSCSF